MKLTRHAANRQQTCSIFLALLTCACVSHQMAAYGANWTSSQAINVAGLPHQIQYQQNRQIH